MYWKVSRKFINKFNLEPAGSKGTWTLDSYQLLSYVFGSAESCLGVQDWYRELVDDCRSVLAVRMFSRHWRDITKDMPPGQPIGVNVHCTQHPIREQSLSSQPSQKTQKLSTQMKNHSHASRIPSLDQSPSCHSAEWKTPLLPCPAS
ncbi:hypothetical protein TNCV_1953891 [Trichonephila clavipes]|nr:hypothetical protein TNCV_1953891 [Trichonephila clavipes]